MTYGVIDALEIVEVDHQQCNAALVAASANQRHVQAVMKKRSSRQAGQRVVVGNVGDVLLDTFSLSDVMGDAQKPQNLPGLVCERGDDKLNAKPGTVLANIGPFGIIRKTVVCDYFEDCHPGIHVDSEFLTQIGRAA